MKAQIAMYLATLVLAGLLAQNVYLGLESGSPFSWAAAVFIAVMIGYVWVQEIKR